MKKFLVSILAALSVLTTSACQYDIPIYSQGGFCVPYISHINGNIAWEYFSDRPRLECRQGILHLPITVRIGITSRYREEPLYGVMEYKDEFGILEDTQLEIRLDYSIDDGATWILLRSKIFRNARQSTIRNYTLGRNLITENLPAGSKILLRLRCGPPGFTKASFKSNKFGTVLLDEYPEITGGLLKEHGTVELVSEFTITGPRRPGRN